MNELLQDLSEGVLTLSINRPEQHNTLTATLSAQLKVALLESAERTEVRCVVITGVGNVFCAGGDVANVSNKEGIPESATDNQSKALKSQADVIREGSETIRVLYELPKPTLAIMPGAAAGSGLALALACDLRFCLDTAKLTTAFSRLGLSGDCAGSFLMSQLIGPAKTKELFFTSDVVSGAQALKMGLVNQVASIDTFAQEARSFAERLAALPTVALAHIKQNVNAAQESSISSVLDLEANNIALCMQTADHQAAVAAFLNKEVVNFVGR